MLDKNNKWSESSTYQAYGGLAGRLPAQRGSRWEVMLLGLIVVRKARRAIDYLKLRWLLLNPISKSVVDELLERRDGKLKAEELLDAYPQRPRSLSWLSFQASTRILGVVREGLGDEVGSDEEFALALRKPEIRRMVLNILLTLQTYGVRQPQRFYAPLMIVWNLTWRCNLRCKHCYQSAGALGGDIGTPELTLDEKLAAVDKIAASLIPTLSLSGGEPLIHPHFWPVAEAARQRGIYLSLNTNGTLITEEVAERLAALGFAYAGISVDAPSKEYHDSFRGVAGSWDKTVRGIKALAKTSVLTILSFTITKENYSRLPQIFGLAEELGMDKVMVYNYIPTGRARDNMDLDLTPEQREEAFSMMYRYAASGGSLCSTAPQMGRLCAEAGHAELIPLAHAGPGRAQDLQILAQIIGGCGIGRAYLALQPDGRITPCVYLPDLEIGDIRRDDIIEIWQSNELLESLASHQGLKGHCGVCEHRAVCGGCRARAYAYFGDFKAPDPGCINNRDYYYAQQAGALPCDASAAPR